MKRFSRRMWWLPAIAAGSLKGHDVPVVATGNPGEIVFEFIGTINQNGANFAATGYLTAVAGLPEKVLFADPVTRSHDSARFTFAAAATLVSRNVIRPMFVLDETGVITISYRETAGGMPVVVASGPVNLQSTVQVIAPFMSAQSPGKGNFRLTGEFVRTQTSSFELGGVNYEFGEARIPWLLTASGDGTLTEPNAPISQVVAAGNAVAGGGAAFSREGRR